MSSADMMTSASSPPVNATTAKNAPTTSVTVDAVDYAGNYDECGDVVEPAEFKRDADKRDVHCGADTACGGHGEQVCRRNDQLHQVFLRGFESLVLLADKFGVVVDDAYHAVEQYHHKCDYQLCQVYALTAYDDGDHCGNEYDHGGYKEAESAHCRGAFL